MVDIWLNISIIVYIIKQRAERHTMKELNTVLEAIRKIPTTRVRIVGPSLYSVEINCGRLPSGIDYSGYWGEGTTCGDELVVLFTVGDLYDDGEFGISTLSTRITTNSTGLPYSSNLDGVVSDMLNKATNGLFTCSGSEQGMQDFDKWTNGTVTHYYNADVELELVAA